MNRSSFCPDSTTDSITSADSWHKVLTRSPFWPIRCEPLFSGTSTYRIAATALVSKEVTWFINMMNGFASLGDFQCLCRRMSNANCLGASLKLHGNYGLNPMTVVLFWFKTFIIKKKVRGKDSWTRNVIQWNLEVYRDLTWPSQIFQHLYAFQLFFESCPIPRRCNPDLARILQPETAATWKSFHLTSDVAKRSLDISLVSSSTQVQKLEAWMVKDT